MRACIQAAGVTSFGALENLANAYSTLYRYLKDNYDDTKKLKKYWGYLTNNVVPRPSRSATPCSSHWRRAYARRHLLMFENCDHGALIHLSGC